MWRIYYEAFAIQGEGREDWQRAPPSGVQVVVSDEFSGLRWTCDGKPVRDRTLWTGQDVYDPFGWGPKEGSLIGDAEYQEIWRRACGDHLA